METLTGTIPFEPLGGAARELGFGRAVRHDEGTAKGRCAVKLIGTVVAVGLLAGVSGCGDASPLHGRLGSGGAVGSASAVARSLAFGTHDVLLVHDEPSAGAGTLRPMGSSWAPALGSLLEQGGVIVLLATASGTNEMGAFLSGAGSSKQER